MIDSEDTLLPLVEPDGRVIGSVARSRCHDGSKTYLHPVVHLHVFNSKGELYLQQRGLWKRIQPGKWDTACGGHIDYGETTEEALRREVREEIGITDYTPEAITHYVFESGCERELVYVFATTYDGEVRPAPDELEGGRFWSTDEIEAAIGKGLLTPNFEQEFREIVLPWRRNKQV